VKTGAPQNSGKNDKPFEIPLPDKRNAIGTAPVELPGSAAREVEIPAADELLLQERLVELPNDGASVPEVWIKELRRRAEHPLAISSEYKRAIAACEAEMKAQRQAKPSPYGLSSGIWTARFWAWVVAVAIMLVVLGWLGLEVAEAIVSLPPHIPGR
jgi:hypothetical protein